jgi:hypothetical protein
MNWTGLSGALAITVIAAGLPAPQAAPQASHGGQMATQKRGEHPMGFDDARTTHHFRLSPKGGTIEVHVNDPKDRQLRDQVVAHLGMIAGQFAHGDFRAPFAVHGEDPAGVPVLKRLSRAISYTFVPDDTGGRIVISTRSKKALAAVHDFLRYQIREHGAK